MFYKKSRKIKIGAKDQLPKVVEEMEIVIKYPIHMHHNIVIISLYFKIMTLHHYTEE